MSFGEKIKRAFQKMKSRIIVYLLAIFVGIFFLVSPISRAITDANIAAKEGKDWFEVFFTNVTYISEVGKNLTQVFTARYFHNFFTGAVYFFAFALIFIFVGVYKALPKHEYDDIEAFFLFDADNLVSKNYTNEMLDVMMKDFQENYGKKDYPADFSLENRSRCSRQSHKSDD